MKTRKSLPSVKAFDAPRKGQWDAPSSAFDKWEPVCAASDNSDNVINMYDQIGETWDGAGVTARLVNSILCRAKGEKVTINMNSPGGDFFEGVTIYNLLREYDGEVEVNVIGLSASAASVIAMAADELRVAKSGFLMIHNSWGVVVGNQNDMREAAETFAIFDKAMAGVYSARSGMNSDEIAELMAGDYWMTGEDAVELGFADAFLNSDEVIEDDEKKSNAKHQMDVALAKQGVPRSERRKMFKEIGTTQNAGTSTTQNAGEIESVLSAINELKSTMKGT